MLFLFSSWCGLLLMFENPINPTSTECTGFGSNSWYLELKLDLGAVRYGQAGHSLVLFVQYSF